MVLEADLSTDLEYSNNGEKRATLSLQILFPKRHKEQHAGGERR